MDEELKQNIENIENRLRILETKKPEISDKNIKKEFINSFNIIKSEKFIFDSFYSQDSEPSIAFNSFAFWIDTNGGPAYYLIFNFNGTQKKVALT